jgi:predicted RNase H-like HicB family nuclease
VREEVNMSKYKYLVLVEGGNEPGYSAYAPDVPGCASAGDTVEETLANFREALQMHLEGTFEDGDPAPPATLVAAEFVEVEVEQPAPASA